MTRAVGPLAAALLGAAVACSPVEPRDDPDPASFHLLGEGRGRSRGTELERYRRLWEERGPPAYRFVLTRQCFCPDGGRPVRLEVRQDAVARAEYVDSGEAVREEWRHLWPPVDGLFAILEDAVTRGARTVRVAWDPALGHPTRIWIDYDEAVIDEEQGFLVEDLAPLLP